MITFKQFILEAFNKPYKFDIDNIDTDGTVTEYKLSFSTKTGGDYIIYIRYDKPTNTIRVDFTDENESVDVTGSEGIQSIRVFSTINVALKKALIQHPGAEIEFDADLSQPTRVRLYRSLARKLASSLKRRVSEYKAYSYIRFTIK